MGELHLEVLIDRLKREFKVDCNQGKPQVAYKETITEEVVHEEVFDKQTGGKGRFAKIKVMVKPGDENEKGLSFNCEKSVNIKPEFIRAVERGFTEAMHNGPIMGYPLHSLNVYLMDAESSDEDSDEMAFEIVARMAFRSATRKASPRLLEPIMKAEIVTPEEYVGDILADFNRRRANIEGTESRSSARIIKAFVPLSEQFGYVTDLRTITSGRGSSTMEFSHYDEVPDNIEKKILNYI